MKPEDCHHIFAYGSLMWRPDFEYVKSAPGHITGYHRRLSIISHHYRGTPEKPGLVLGLDSGGSCVGVLYEVAAEKWPEVLAYIRKRELISEAYREVVKEVKLDEQLESVQAVTYVVNHGHSQYFAPQAISKTLAMVMQGHGLAGSCVDYILNTVAHLRGLGIHEAELENIIAHLPSSSRANPR
jgi:glutathione-specific gamma-glutamylcyclotransferase